MEVCPLLYQVATVVTKLICLPFGSDIHLSNVLLAPSSNFDDLSIKQLYEKFGSPQVVPISRVDGSQEPLPALANVPAEAVQPLSLAPTDPPAYAV